MSDRKLAILAQLEVAGQVLVTELAAVHEVSDVTIRKDLRDLEQQSLLKRVHGGAVVLHRSKWNPSIERRKRRERSAKAAIAEAAMRFVRDGDTIILDAGTSTLALARRLRGRARNLTVITNSFPVVAELAEEDEIEVISLGGFLRHHSLAMIGPLTVASLQRLHADVAFLGATGAQAERGLCTPNLIEAETKAAMVRSSTERVALVDHAKIGEVSLAPFCSWDDLNALVTDAPVPDRFARRLAAHSVDLVLAGDSAATMPYHPLDGNRKEDQI